MKISKAQHKIDQWKKNFLLIFLFQIISIFAFSQELQDFKIKTSKNAKERTEILDLARNDIKKSIQQEIVFKVKHFKVSKNYAWLEVDVNSADGKTIQLPDDSYDCCHAEGLFKKVKGKWSKVEFNSFSTDCWYCGIASRFPKVPRSIFTEAAFSH